MAQSELTRDDIRGIAYGFQGSRALLTAYELGVFRALGDSRRASSAVAAEIGADPRATDRLMNALCALRVLGKENGRFYNTDAAREALVPGDGGDPGGLMHTVHLWNTWGTLTEAVKKGKSVLLPGVNERGERWLTAFIAAMHDRASRQAPAAIAQLDLARVNSVLDVGGGSGAYAMAFARAKKGLRATVFDLPNVLPITRGYIEREGLAAVVTTAEGDYLGDELPRGYDLVLLSAIVHSNSPEENGALIAKCARALNSGGIVVVQDFVMDDGRVNPAAGALFALNMLVGTERGDTFTESEITGWMAAAGLSGVSRQASPFGWAQIVGHLRGGR